MLHTYHWLQLKAGQGNRHLGDPQWPEFEGKEHMMNKMSSSQITIKVGRTMTRRRHVRDKYMHQ